eukprot:980013-Prorocentrum_minimum.AAC.1
MAASSCRELERSIGSEGLAELLSPPPPGARSAPSRLVRCGSAPSRLVRSGSAVPFRLVRCGPAPSRLVRSGLVGASARRDSRSCSARRRQVPVPLPCDGSAPDFGRSLPIGPLWLRVPPMGPLWLRSLPRLVRCGSAPSRLARCEFVAPF